MNINYDMWVTICFIAGTLFLCLLVYFIRKCLRDNAPLKPIYVLSVLVLLAYGSGGMLRLIESNNIYVDVETKLTQSGYVFYVDGRETEPENIDIKKYNASSYTINDSEKKITLSTQGK